MSLKDDISTFTADVETHVRSFFDHHGPEIEKLAALAESVDSDPLMQAAQAAAGLTPGMRQAFADLIAKADAEVTRVVQEATASGHEAGHAAAVAELCPPAPAEPAAEAPAA